MNIDATSSVSLIDPSRVYRLTKLLARTESTRVYEAYSQASKLTVALKIVASSDSAAWNELDVLRHVASCAHVVHLHAAYIFDGSIWLALELAVCSVARVLSMRTLTETEVRAVLYFATRALQFLHALPLLHCDVKGANLLLYADGSVKLADFGSAIRLDALGTSPRGALSRGTSPSSASSLRNSFASTAPVDWAAASPPRSPAPLHPSSSSRRSSISSHDDVLELPLSPLRTLHREASMPERPRRSREPSFSSVSRLRKASETSTDGASSVDDPALRSLGTCHFSAPELLERVVAAGNVTVSASWPLLRPSLDVWSLGITLIELVDSKPPFSDVLPQLVAKEILASPAMPTPRMPCSDALTAFLTRCLRRNPLERVAVAELVVDPLIALTADDATETLLPLAQSCANRSMPMSPLLRSGGSDSGGNSSSSSSSADSSDSESDSESSSSDDSPLLTKIAAAPPVSAPRPGRPTMLMRSQSLSTMAAASPQLPTLSKTLVELAATMRQPVAKGGIERKRRFLRLQVYEDAFTGQQAVDWVCAHTRIASRRAALDVLQTLQYRGIVRHVTQSACMRDSPNELYELVKRPFVASLAELRRLGERMFGTEDPLVLRDVRVRLRLVRGCLSGEELVVWLQRSATALSVLDAAESRVRAAHLAQQLVCAHVIVPIDHDPALPDVQFSDRASSLYRPSCNTARLLLKLIDSQPQLTCQFADIGGDVVRDILTRMHARVGGVGTSPRRGSGVVARDVITWLVGNEPRVLKSRAIAVELARELALRGAFFDADSKTTLVSDSAQQTLSFCDAPTVLVTDGGGAGGAGDSNLRARDTLHRLTMQLTPAALLRREFEIGDGIIEAHIDALLEIVQGKPAAAVDAEAARDPSVRLAAARSLLAQCFGFVAPDAAAGPTENARQLAEIAALLYDAQEHTDIGDELGEQRDMRDSHTQVMSRRRARLYQSGAFTVLVELALANNLVVHRELRAADVVVPLEAIGKGATATVFRGELGANKLKVAVKRFCEGEAPLANPLEFQRELTLLALVRHRHLVQFLGARLAPPEQCLVFRFYTGGTVENKLFDKTFALTWPMRVGWAAAVAEAVAFLHSLKIIFRDVKSSNVLLDDKLNAYLCDFGTARLMPNDPKQLTRMVGTTAFMAPEVFRKEHYNVRTDVYSFGVFLAELGTRAEPFAGVPLWDIPELVMRGERPQLPTAAPFTFSHLLEECWVTDPNARPSMARVARRLRAMHREMRLTADTSKSRFNLHMLSGRPQSVGEMSGASSEAETRSSAPLSSSDKVRSRSRRHSRRASGDQETSTETSSSVVMATAPSAEPPAPAKYVVERPPMLMRSGSTESLSDQSPRNVMIVTKFRSIISREVRAYDVPYGWSHADLLAKLVTSVWADKTGGLAPDCFAVLVGDMSSGEPIGQLADSTYGPAETHEGLVESHVQPLYLLVPCAGVEVPPVQQPPRRSSSSSASASTDESGRARQRRRKSSSGSRSMGPVAMVASVSVDPFRAPLREAFEVIVRAENAEAHQFAAALLFAGPPRITAVQQVVAREPGVFVVQMALGLAGTYTLSITLDNEPISGSPVQLHAPKRTAI